MDSLYSECDDFIIDDTQTLFIEINGNNTGKLVVGVIYQLPDSDFNIFETKLDELLYCRSIRDKDKLLHSWGL